VPRRNWHQSFRAAGIAQDQNIKPDPRNVGFAVAIQIRDDEIENSGAAEKSTLGANARLPGPPTFLKIGNIIRAPIGDDNVGLPSPSTSATRKWRASPLVAKAPARQKNWWSRARR